MIWWLKNKKSYIFTSFWNTLSFYSYLVANRFVNKLSYGKTREINAVTICAMTSSTWALCCSLLKYRRQNLLSLSLFLFNFHFINHLSMNGMYRSLTFEWNFPRLYVHTYVCLHVYLPRPKALFTRLTYLRTYIHM